MDTQKLCFGKGDSGFKYGHFLVCSYFWGLQPMKSSSLRLAYVQELDDAVGTGRFFGGFFPGENPLGFPRFFWGKMFRVKLVIHPGPVNHEGCRPRVYFLVYHVVPGYGESQLTRFWMVCVWGVALESPDDSGAIHLQLGFFSAFIWCYGMLCFVDSRWHPVQCRGGGLEQIKLDELSHHRERKGRKPHHLPVPSAFFRGWTRC